MAGGEDGNSGENPAASTPESPTSAGFNTDQIPRTSENFTDDDELDADDEAAVDPEIIRDEPEEVEEEDEGEDLFNDVFLESVLSSHHSVFHFSFF